MTNNPNRRKAVQIIAVGVTTTLLLPTKWTKPVIETFVVPAHAQASPPDTTPTPTPTESVTVTL